MSPTYESHLYILTETCKALWQYSQDQYPLIKWVAGIQATSPEDTNIFRPKGNNILSYHRTSRKSGFKYWSPDRLYWRTFYTAFHTPSNANTGILPQTRSRLLLSTSFLIHYSLIIQPLEALSDLLTTSKITHYQENNKDWKFNGKFVINFLAFLPYFFTTM
jgi:hypothetical protein